jgi:tetratricopeptide (TPR) repeat protein
MISGRIRRRTYLISFFLVSLLGLLISGIALILPIPLFILIAQGARRCHDLGHSGWYQFIPFYFLWLLLADSEYGENDWGKNPKGVGNRNHGWEQIQEIRDNAKAKNANNSNTNLEIQQQEQEQQVKEEQVQQEQQIQDIVKEQEEYQDKENNTIAIDLQIINDTIIPVKALEKEATINTNPSLAIVHRNIGYANLEIGNYKEAIEDFTKAILLNIYFIDAYLNRGRAYLKDQKFMSAIEDFNKVINSNPNDKNTFLLIGEAYDNLQNYNEAIQNYTRSINIDNDFAQAYFKRSESKLKVNDFLGAIEDSNKYIDLN